MLVIGYTSDGRVEKPKRAVPQPKRSLLPVGRKEPREKVVLPEPRTEGHQTEPGTRVTGKMHSLVEMPPKQSRRGNYPGFSLHWFFNLPIMPLSG